MQLFISQKQRPFCIHFYFILQKYHLLIAHIDQVRIRNVPYERNQLTVKKVRKQHLKFWKSQFYRILIKTLGNYRGFITHRGLITSWFLKCEFYLGHYGNEAPQRLEGESPSIHFHHS